MYGEADADALNAREGLPNDTRFGVASDFPVKCFHQDIAPINNTTAVPGNQMEFEIPHKPGVFLDPQNLRAAFQFNLISSSSTYDYYTYAFDYNSKSLMLESNLEMNDTNIYNLKEVHRFSMIMSDMFDSFSW